MLTRNLGTTPRSPCVNPSTCVIWRETTQATWLKKTYRSTGRIRVGVEPTVDRTPTAAALLAEPAVAVRKEKETPAMPRGLPTVNDAHHWLALTASALVEASAYDDRAEVAWFSKVNSPNIPFEALADSE